MGYDVPVSKETIERYSHLQAHKRRRHDIDTAEGSLLLAIIDVYCNMKVVNLVNSKKNLSLYQLELMYT